MSSPISRRTFMASTATFAGAAATATDAAPTQARQPKDVPGENYKISKGRIRQSVMGWCLKPVPVDKLIDACHAMGMPAMEGISRDHYPKLKSRGMTVAIVGSHGFKQGPLDPEHRAMCLAKLREAIDLAAEIGAPNVITFTGMKTPGIGDRAASKNCVSVWKDVMGQAEEQGVNLCLEHLNSRDDTHPMKGHPGYFGDDVDQCVDLIKQVGSPRMKLLFDIYHVQIMNGDVIRRIGQYQEVIGHYHTAGNPGRGELDDTQEINYPAVMRAILETGYTGFVAQEFIPTWADKLAALRHGVRVCDV